MIQLNDTTRAAIMVLVGNLISAGVLFGLLHWDSDQVAIANSVVNSGMIAFMAIFKKGQQPG